MDRDVTDQPVARADMYSFLAALFLQEPDVQTLPGQLQALQLARHYAPASQTAVLADIRQEYYDCFFVPMSAKYTPPFESALSASTGPGRFGALAGPEAREAANLYEATGFDPQALHSFAPLKETALPDHVGFELAFMAYLCLQESRSAERGESDAARRWAEWQMRFLSGHLNGWLPKLAAELAQRQAEFYAAAAALAAGWTAADFDELAASYEGRADNGGK